MTNLGSKILKFLRIQPTLRSPLDNATPKWSKITFKQSCISLMTSWYSDFFVIFTEAPSKNVSFWNDIVFVTFCDSELNNQKRCPELLPNWHLNAGLKNSPKRSDLSYCPGRPDRPGRPYRPGLLDRPSPDRSGRPDRPVHLRKRDIPTANRDSFFQILWVCLSNEKTE